MVREQKRGAGNGFEAATAFIEALFLEAKFGSERTLLGA
jgi:hypothetical protein